MNEPVIVAHRGYPADCAENSLASVQAAVDAGALWIEVDVQLHNGMLVLAHDIDQPGAPLYEFAAWLADHPQITALVELKNESLVRHGHEQIVTGCLDVMRGAWHPIGFDYDALALAVSLGSVRPGWVVCGFDQYIAARARLLQARWLIINQMYLPAGLAPIIEHSLCPEPCEWMAYEIATLDQANDLMARGVRWLETMNFPAIRDGLRTCSA